MHTHSVIVINLYRQRCPLLPLRDPVIYVALQRAGREYGRRNGMCFSLEESQRERESTHSAMMNSLPTILLECVCVRERERKRYVKRVNMNDRKREQTPLLLIQISAIVRYGEK